MSTSDKHYKFINSQTGNALSYRSFPASLSAEELKEELRKTEEQVATQNGLNVTTINWEEIPESER